MSDEMAEVRAALAKLKSRGGPAIEAHSHSSRNGSELRKSDRAGCFYCCSIFRPSEIRDWVDEGKDANLLDEPRDGSTALCPKCGIDSVIGDASGFPVRDQDFLKEMNRLWFSTC